MEEEIEVGVGITPDEFALKIKDKYPEYKNVDNTVLVEKMLEKYPQYKDRVKTITPQQTKGVLAEENGGLQSTSAGMAESSLDSNLADPTKPKPKTNQITPTKEVGGRQKLDINVIKDFEQQAQELASLPDRGMAYKNEASRQIQDEYARKGIKNFNISPEEVDDRAFTLMRQDKVNETSKLVEEQQKEEEEYNFWEDTWKKVKANASTAVGGIAGIPNLVSKGLFYAFADEDDMKFVNSLEPEAREAFINASLGGLGNAQFAQASADTQQYFKEISQAIQKEIHQFDTNILDDLSNGDYSKAGQRIASEGIGSIPSIIQSMIPYVGLASIAGGTAANKQEELEDEGYDLSGKSLSNSVINGASEALFEMVTAKLGSKLYKTLGEAPAAGREAIIQSMVDNLVKAPLAEGASEGATTLVQDLSDKFIQGKEKEFQQIFKDVVDSSLVGAAVGGGLGASTMTLERTKAIQEDVSINRVINSDTNNYSSIEDAFKGDMRETSLDQLILASKSSMTNRLDSALNKQVEAGTMNEREASNIRLNLAKTQLSLSKTMGIPMDNASRVEAVNLINQKEDLKDQIKNMDDALAIPKKEQLKQIDARLAEIASGKTTTNEEISTSTEPVENVTEVQEASVPEGGEATSEDQTDDTQVTEEKPTRKAKNVQDLEAINKEVFGLDEEQSKASSIIMDQLIGTMAERAGVEKSEIYDKLDFNKGDQSTFEDLSEKGKALFQIVGTKGNLSRLVKTHLTMASLFEREGRSPEEIRLRTGWERGADGKWTYELDSSQARLKQDKLESGKLEDIVDFPELYEVYPELKDVDVVVNPNMDAYGIAMIGKNRIMLNPNLLTNSKESLSTALHEIQHFVQNIEGFSTGGNSEQVRSILEKAIDKKPFYVEKLIELKEALFGKDKNTLTSKKNADKIKEFLKKTNYELYKSLTGEVQARNVQTRQEMTASERRRKLISETEDVPRSEQISLVNKKPSDMFQITGEKANLSEETRNKLIEANRLESEGKSPKEIWIATGWEKGADGKWRVEFDDSNMKLNEDFRSMRNHPLDEALDYKELFELYPEMKEVKFSVIPRLGSMKGAYVPAKNLIMVNGELSNSEVRSTILHEIQHIIQSKEGFATGGTPKMAIDYLTSKLKRLKLAKNLPNSVVKAADKLSKSLFSGININESKNNFVKEINNIKNRISEGEWDAYQSIAGEVESRNVQNRMNMTEQERRETPLSETETRILSKEYSDDPDIQQKIGRDEQIVLFQEAKGAAEIGQDGQAIIHALTNPDVSTPLHELAHVYEGYLSESEKNDILEWSGQEEWNRETSENFARGFEKYLAEGKAPNAKLQEIFDNFKKWLTDIYNGIKGSEIDLEISPKMQAIFDSMIGAEATQNVVDTLNARTQEIIDGEGDSEFKIRKLLGGVPVLSYLDDVWYRNISKRVDKSTAQFVKNALDSNNKVVRVIGQTATNWFNGLPRTVEELSDKRRLRGKQEVAFITGEEMTKNLNQLINFSVESAERVHKVMDPELYNEEERISLEDLNQEERQLYDQLKDINSKTHDLNYKEGFIDKETYEKYKDNYIGRAYEPYENLSGEVDEQGEFIDSRIMDKIYKQRKSIDEWKQENKITDPIYLTVNRMIRTERNMAVKAYADGISKNSKLSSTEPKEGYVELKGKQYGSLDGKYVPHYIAEDFKGFSFTNKYMDAIYDGVKGYDKLKARQFLKKYHTVYSPLVQVGNFMSNHAFAFASGINLPELWGNLPEASKSIKSKDSDYKTLVENGILGSDVITSDFTALTKGAQERAALNKEKESKKSLMNFLRKADKKATDLYSHSDDVMKMSAYKALRKQGYNEKEAIERVFDGFQNYSTVGKAWDFAAKTPVIGNAYVKFQADLMRIMKNAVIKRPLSTAAFLGSVRLITMMTSMMSGEDDEKREIRESRGFIPKINLGFTEIPLVAKVGGKEVNLARYLAPYYEYDIPNKDWLSSASRFAPFQFQVSENAEKGQAGVSIETPDVLLGGLFQAFAQNRDFRNKSISDPTATRYTESGLDSDEKTFNKLNYVARSVVPMYSTAQDAYLSAMYGEDFYGRTKSVSDNFISKVVKVETYGDKELEKTINRQIKSFDYEQKAVNDKLKSIKRAFQKDMIELEDKVDEGVLDPEKASRKQEKLEKEYERKQNKYLNELVKIQEKFNEYVDKTDAIQLNTDY